MNRALKIISYILWVLCVAGNIFYMIYAIEVIHGYGSSGYGFFLCFFALSFLTASCIHELGHFVFGLFSGMRAKLTLKSVLPLMHPSSVEIVPKKEDKLKSRLIATALGGVFFNLIFIVLGVAALFVPQIPVWVSPIAIWHLSLFLDNIFPIEFKTGKSDGLVIYELIKNTPQSQVMLAVLRAQAHILSGKPIEELNKSVLFSLPQIAEDDPAFISLTELRAAYLKATGDEEGANMQLARFEELKKEYID